MANKKQKALQKQKIAMGAALFLIVGVLIYLFSILATEVPLGEYEEGTHYSLIEQPRKVRGNKIEIMEFFSYGCVHCYNLDPNLSSWIEKNQHTVKLTRMPLVGNPSWELFARAYFTMETLDLLHPGHERIFHMIHAGGNQFNSAEDFADVATNNPEDRSRFINTFNSTNTTRLLERSDKLARQFKIATVPNVVVQGKYLVRTNRNVGLSRMLEVMQFLLEKEAEQPNKK